MIKLALKSLVFSSLALATFSASAQDIARGGQLYQSSNCMMCHGVQGEGLSSFLGPKIGGQHDWYLLTALNDFKARERKNPEMYPYIQNLTEKDFKDLASYISTLTGLE